MEWSLSDAQSLIAQAIEQARGEFGRPICVAVCDRYGFLLAFARMAGAPVRSIAISQGKAYSAARMGVDTDAFLERLHRENLQLEHFCDPLLMALPGGSVLKNRAGELIGGVGVSGLLPREDQEITRRMAAAAQEFKEST